MLLWLALAIFLQNPDTRTIRPHPLMPEYNRAWVLEGQSRPDEAIALLERIISRDKTFYRAYKCLADAYGQKHDLDGAERYFRRLLADDPRNGLAHYGLALVSERREQTAAASAHFAACVKETPQNHACYRGMGYYFDKQQLDMAGADARIASDSRSPYAYLGLAGALEERRQNAEAVKVLRRGLEAARAFGDPEWIAAFEFRLAARAADGVRSSAAEEAYRLYVALGDWEGQFNAMGQWGNMHSALGEQAQALARFEDYVALARNFGHREWEAEALFNVALYHSRLGRLETALSWMSEAKLVARPSGLGSWRVSEGMAKIYARLGDTGRQIESLNQALDAAPASWYEALVLRGLGEAYGQSGDYVKALEYGHESVQRFRAGGYEWHAGAGVRRLASVHEALGDLETARACFEESLRSGRKHRDSDEEEGNLLSLGGISLKTGKTKEAVGYFEQAVEAGKRNGYNYVPYKVRESLGLGEAHGRLGDGARAAGYLEDGVRLAREARDAPLEAGALSTLGRFYLESGNLPEAERYFSESLTIAEASGYADLILAARRGFAETTLRRGDYPRALQELERAIRVMESLRAPIRGTDLQSSFVQQHWKVYEEIIGVLARAGRGEEAFAYAERGRARAFLDTLEESKARVTKGLTGEQQRRQRDLFDALSKALSARDKAGSAKAERALADWVLELRHASPAYRELRYPEPYDAKRARVEMARRGGVLLEYVLGDRRSHVWAVSGERVRMAALPPRREIEKEVEAYRALVSRRPRAEGASEVRQRARRLYDMLVKPVEGDLGKSGKVVVAPDGTLYYLPFEALLRADGRYLIEDHAVAYIPSASVLGQLAAPRPAPRDLLAYGDPDFGSAAGAIATARGPEAPIPSRDREGAVEGPETADLVRRVYGPGGARFTRLPNTRVEVEAIAGLYPAGQRRSYLGCEATEPSVKREKLTDYRRLHFATHAVLDDHVPSRSGVVLSLVNTGREDGVLRMSEIFNLELNAEVVVLSACQTGLGKLMQGEGMVGLTRAFMYAGTPRVVVSLWEVNDIATAEFMKAFYGQMRAGKAPGEALRQAKLTMLRSEVAAYRNPYYWTPFVLVGAF